MFDCTCRCSQHDDKDYADAQPYKDLDFSCSFSGSVGAEFVTRHPGSTNLNCRGVPGHGQITPASLPVGYRG